MSEQATVHLKVRRQDGPGMPSYWHEFRVPYTPGMNIITCLDEIRRSPVTAQGQRVPPVVWECSCLEEVCGACSMRINGVPQQSCSALVEKFSQPITLEPMSKFPVVRDLMVDRQIMFDNLIKIKGWVPIDGTHDIGAGPRQPAPEQGWMYILSRCMTCGCCLDACPQVNERSELHGRGADQPGAAIQRPPHRSDAQDRAPRGPDGTRRHRRLRQCAKLRARLSRRASR